MQRRSVALVFGTRPEAVKMAPLVKEFAAHDDFQPLVVTTGQHSGLVAEVLAGFGLEPDIELSVRRERQTLAELNAEVLNGIDDVLQRYKPQVVLAHGDTTTTLATALASFYRMVPLVHVEAGLRSHDRWSPYPEEVNRRIVSLVTNLHLAPTPSARRNLLAEGVDPGSVVVTGNTVIDAMSSMPEERGWSDPALTRLDQDPRRAVLFTVHRRESWGPPMAHMAKTMAAVADSRPDLLLIACVHPGPAVRAALLPALRGRANVMLVGPQPYGTFLRLIRRSSFVVTDSGGVQEECTGLGRPVLVLRDTTERQEGVESGGIRLVGTDPTSVRAAVEELWDDPALYARMSTAVCPFGDGRAAARCTAAVARLLGLTDEPVAEFEPVPMARGANR
ncbi:non-hydrolyzing UDP-N-acetylglucosamine 2-epimerase [Streptomyces umbrinus]